MTTAGLAVRLSADQLAALAHALDLPGFPGAPSALLAGLPEPQRAPLVQALLATLAADGLVQRTGERLAVDAELAVLLVPLLQGDTWLVERTEGEQQTTTLVGALDGVVVVHTAGDGLHDLVRGGDLLDVLLELVDASEAGPVEGRALRGPRSGLLGRAALRPTVETWRATTTLQRLAATGGPAVEKVAVVDGGPDRVWWVGLDPEADGELDDEDPALVATPVQGEELARRLAAWAG